MSEDKTPDQIVSEAILALLQGMRFSDSPAVGIAAGRREIEETARLKNIKGQRVRLPAAA